MDVNSHSDVDPKYHKHGNIHSMNSNHVYSLSRHLTLKSTSLLLLFFSFAILSGFIKPHAKYTTIIIGYGSGLRYANSDTIFIHAIDKAHINDTIKKYVSTHSLSVKSVLIAQPSEIIDSIDFKLFPGLEELTLSGNDDDVLQNRRYNFMDVKSLERINLHAVFVEYPISNGDNDDHYTYKAKIKFRKFIHAHRPDIKVSRLNKFDYRIVWTD